MSHPSGTVAKPAALTTDVQAAIVDALARGEFLGSACRGAGVTSATYYHWRARARRDDPPARPYAGFFEAADRAGAVAEAEALSRIRAGGRGWESQAWFLARRFPRRWGRARRTDGSASSDKFDA